MPKNTNAQFEPKLCLATIFIGLGLVIHSRFFQTTVCPFAVACGFIVRQRSMNMNTVDQEENL
ncbi:hypothetical protein [Pseudorhodoferax sp.]|uniref:hypothetical protein n=1 Tax=Pseudorhodoferax sp. TaxID=1993553 RepID=UPI0039E5AF4A